MADIQSYSDLVNTIQSVAEDNGSEFIAYIPYAVSLAEQRLNRELDLPDLETKAVGTLSATVNTLLKPTGYRYANYIHILVPDPSNPASLKKTYLKKRREDYINDYWPDATLTATPKYYGDQSVTNLVFAPTPDVSYSYEIKYTTEPARLGTLNQNNYFTSRCVDILYAASMVEMALFMKVWSQIPVWETAYKTLKDGWNLTMQRQRKDDGESPDNPSQPLNTVQHAPKTNA